MNQNILQILTFSLLFYMGSACTECQITADCDMGETCSAGLCASAGMWNPEEGEEDNRVDRPSLFQTDCEESGHWYDTNSEMCWQNPSTEQLSWNRAIALCETLELDGLSHWRLPDIEELSSIKMQPISMGIATTPSSTNYTDEGDGC